MSRALLLVLDSVGCGHAPDAGHYGDAGANTLGHILTRRPGLQLSTLRSLGLDTALALAEGAEPSGLPARGAVGVMTERSAGKDTTTGHWEIAGTVITEPFPVFEKFPPELVATIEHAAGVQFIGNHASSGTAILDALGSRHIETGHPILYTSADSVLQIAAHEDIIPLHRLYAICEIARKAADSWRIGRVIARPFIGVPGAFQRTAGRHDFSMRPPRNILNALTDAKIPVTGIGKISDIFAASGIAESHPTRSNSHGMRVLDELWDSSAEGLLFANLVDFDMLYGHRRDVDGYAGALEAFDAWLAGFLDRVREDDLVIITADHGNDPTFPGTDHTRERVPLFVLRSGPPAILGIRDTFADIAASLAVFFGLDAWDAGVPFL